jgi:hypothetical protein
MKAEDIKNLLSGKFGAQLDEWKRLYGKIKGYGADGKVAVFRPATIQILDACRTISQGSIIKYDVALIENCWLGGDEELKTEDRYLLGLINWGAELIESVAGEMVEL